MGSAPKVPKPQDPLALAGGQSSQLLSYYGSEVPKFMELQSQLGPGLMAQMLGQSSQFLKGVEGQPGFNKLQKSAGKVAGQTIAELRARELGQMTGQAGLTRGLMEAISPEQAAAVRASAQEAERARASAQGVTPQEQRMYEQTAREGAQAAGRLGGNAGLAAEIMGREGVLGSKREEAARAGARAAPAPPRRGALRSPPNPPVVFFSQGEPLRFEPLPTIRASAARPAPTVTEL